MDNNHYAIAKVQKVFGLTSGKGEKFGLGQEKSYKIKKVPKYLELIERFHIFAPSKFLFDYAAECGEQGFIDTAPFLKSRLFRGGFLSFIGFLKKREKLWFNNYHILHSDTNKVT